MSDEDQTLSKKLHVGRIFKVLSINLKTFVWMSPHQIRFSSHRLFSHWMLFSLVLMLFYRERTWMKSNKHLRSATQALETLTDCNLSWHHECVWIKELIWGVKRMRVCVFVCRSGVCVSVSVVVRWWRCWWSPVTEPHRETCSAASVCCRPTQTSWSVSDQQPFHQNISSSSIDDAFTWFH